MEYSLDFDQFTAIDDLVRTQFHNGDCQVVVINHNQGVRGYAMATGK